jgi:transposase-like protein
VAHANAALTPRARLRLARLIVEQGWPVARAAERFQVSWPTARRWAQRYREQGPAGMRDRSSRPHHCPRMTPAPIRRKIVHLRWKQRLGPVGIAALVGCAPSTVHHVLVCCRINRLSAMDRATGQPVRRYEHPHPGDLVHADVKKLGNIPDGGGWRYVGRAQGKRNRAATPGKPRTLRRDPKMGTGYLHTVLDDHSRVAYTEICLPTPRSARTRPPPPRSRSYDERRPGSRPVACASSESSPITGAATARSCGAMPAPSSASSPRRPAPTGHKPMARLNASIAPSSTGGPSAGSTPARYTAEKPSPAGSTSTTTTDPIPPAEDSHPSPG